MISKIPKPMEYVFYTAGFGTCQRRNGYYVIYLVNPSEKWEKIEYKITNNQAEIKGVILALTIAKNRKYESIEVRTNSLNVIGWILGRDRSLNTNVEIIAKNIYRTINKKISDLIDDLMVLFYITPDLTINFIPHHENLARREGKRKSKNQRDRERLNKRKYQNKSKNLTNKERKLLLEIREMKEGV